MPTTSPRDPAPRSLAAAIALAASLLVASSVACKPRTSAPPPPLSCTDPVAQGRELELESIELGATGSPTFVIAWKGTYPLELDAELDAVEGSSSQMIQGHGRLVRVRLELDDDWGSFELRATTRDGETRCPVRRAFTFETVHGQLQGQAR